MNTELLVLFLIANDHAPSSKKMPPRSTILLTNTEDYYYYITVTSRLHFVFLYLPGAGLAGRRNLSVPEAGALANATPLQDATVFARRARIVASSACSGIFVCHFKLPSSSRRKAQQKIAGVYAGCNTHSGGCGLRRFCA